MMQNMESRDFFLKGKTFQEKKVVYDPDKKLGRSLLEIRIEIVSNKKT